MLSTQKFPWHSPQWIEMGGRNEKKLGALLIERLLTQKGPFHPLFLEFSISQYFPQYIWWIRFVYNPSKWFKWNRCCWWKRKRFIFFSKLDILIFIWKANVLLIESAIIRSYFLCMCEIVSVWMSGKQKSLITYS